MATSLHADSEIGRLQACVLSAPGPEHDAMLPAHIAPLRLGPYGWQANPEYLLFDDLVLLPQLQAEHAVLRGLVAAFAGERGTFDFRTMLGQVLADPACRAGIVNEVLDLDGQLGAPGPQLVRARARMADLAPLELTYALTAGCDPEDGSTLLTGPVPNLLFARDLWAVVGDALVLGYPRTRARKRDGVLARWVAQRHPACKALAVLDIRGGPLPGISMAELDDERCVEGGDVLVLRHDLVLIGVGERTTLTAALRLAELLHARGVSHVLGVILPVARATMHLDTVMTAVDSDLLLVYPPTLGGGDPLQAVALVDLLQQGCAIEAPLPAALAERGVRAAMVPCGDGDPRAAEREQWSDGANALCLCPGGVVLYGRNTATLRALNRAGFEIVQPSYAMDNAELLVQRGDRFVVALHGSELSRGRGGPRCLTLPLARVPFVSDPIEFNATAA